MKEPTNLSLQKTLKEKGLKKWEKDNGYPKGLTALVEKLLTDYINK